MLPLSSNDDLRLLLGHGSGSFGHYAAQQFGFAYQPQSDWRGFAEIGASAARLNRIVIDSFLSEGIPIFPIQPSASARSRAGELIKLESETVGEALQRGLVPVVYGDVCLDHDFGWTIISTEQIMSNLSVALKPKRVIMAGEVAGVYSGNPSDDSDAQLIAEITPGNFAEIQSGLTGADGYDVTGGMLDKVEKMLALVQAQPGLETHLISGAQSGQVQKALLGEPLEERTVIRA